MANQIHAVQTVLEEFFMFDMENDCWFHKRCDETIAAYQAKAERNREVGKLGGRPKSNPDANQEETQVVSKHNPNQEPITINHKPKRESATKVACPPDVSQQVWDDWVTLRKSKKAPITKTVLDGAIAEAKKLGWTLEQFLIEWCNRGSQGLKAEWIVKPNPYDNVRLTVPSKNEPNLALLKIEEDAKKAAPIPLEVLAKMAQIRGRA
jgi:hypothetical protein